MLNDESLKKLSSEQRKKLAKRLEIDGQLYNVYPLSSEQMKMWYFYRLNPGLSYYNCGMHLKLLKQLDDNILTAAFAHVISMHEILHTIYLSVEGKIYQAVLNKDNYSIPYENITAMPDNEEKALYINRPFKLESELPLRMMRDGEDIYVIIHHIADDGWSSGIFISSLYHVLKGNVIDQEKTPEYIDYCLWQKEYLNCSSSDQALAFWKSYFKGNPGFLNLPLDRERGTVQSFSGANKSIEIEEGLYSQLRSLSQSYGVTMFTITMALWLIAMMKLTDDEYVTIGTPTANRLTTDKQKIFGCFVNTVAIAEKNSPNMTSIDFILKLKQNIENVLKYQDIPFDVVVNAVDVKRSLSFSPIYQVFYSLQSKSLVGYDSSVTENEFFRLEPIENETVNSVQNDMDILGIDNGSSIHLGITYNTAIFDGSTIEYILENYMALVKQVVDAPNTLIRDLEWTEKKSPKHKEKISIAEPAANGSDSDKIRETIRSIWSDILKIDSFGNDVSFFDAGGNSMNCLELLEKLNSCFDIELTIVDMFTYNSVDLSEKYISSLVSAKVQNTDSELIDNTMF